MICRRIRAGILTFGLGLVWIGCQDPEPGETPILGLMERQRIEVTAEFREPITHLQVAAGDVIAAGDILARLDDSRPTASVGAAEARVQKLAARIAELERGGRHEALDQARSRITASQVDLDQSRLDLQRSTKLVETGVAPQAELDRARSLAEAAESRLDLDRSRLVELERGATSEELDQARADLAAAQEEVVLAHIELDRHLVRAPVAGRIDAVVYHIGERPEPGSPLVILLADGPAYARVQVPETLRARVGPGTKATLFADGIDRSFSGTVRFVASEASFTPYYALSEHDRHRLSFVAEIDIDPPTGQEPDVVFPSGTPVRVLFDRGDRP